MNLTEEQIKKKKAKFQAKKQRRLARKKALAWHNKLRSCNDMTYAHFSSTCVWGEESSWSPIHNAFYPSKGVPQHHHQQRRELRRQQDKDESLHKNDKKPSIERPSQCIRS